MDIIDDMGWSSQGRTYLHKSRAVGKKDTFFGFSSKELKPQNILAKVFRFSRTGTAHSQKVKSKWRGAIKDHD